MIYYSIPYNTSKNIGGYYNSFMRILPSEDDWACFVDGDTIFTTYDYGYLIEKAVEEHTDASFFTCYTNRVGCPWQIAPGVDTGSDDIRYHRDYSEKLKIIYGTSVDDVTHKSQNQVFSGMLFLIKKKAWLEIGGFKEDGMLGIDSDIHWRLQKKKLKMYIIKGLYVYHWYRGGDKTYKKHLLK